MESFRNNGRLEKSSAWFSGSFMDPYYEIDPLDQGEVHFNITSEVSCASEEYAEKERIFAVMDYDDDDDNDDDDDDDNDGEFIPRAISSSDDSEEGNDEETENN